MPPPASDKEVVNVTQTASEPKIGVGNGLTVTVVVVIQPVDDKVYVIVAVPVAIPVTTPVLNPILAMSASLLVHVPPGVASVNVVVRPRHTFVTPDILAGNGLTVNVAVIAQPVTGKV